VFELFVFGPIGTGLEYYFTTKYDYHKLIIFLSKKVVMYLRERPPIPFDIKGFNAHAT